MQPRLSRIFRIPGPEIWLGTVGSSPSLFAEKFRDVLQVASRVFSGYIRSTLSDGTVKPETYAFGNGGQFDFAMIGGDGVDTLTFEKITRDLAPALARQGYIPATDPASAHLLIVVMWGA